MRLTSTIFLVLMGLSVCLTKAQASVAVGNRFKKVIWVVFENTNYQNALRQPDFASLAKQGVLFTNLSAEVHPSEGNYVAMIAGSNYGIASDANIDLSGNHLGDLLERSNKDWKVYAEDYPGSCFTGKISGNYVRKHNPFMSFLNVSTDNMRCQKIQSADRFDQDLVGNALPEFTMYIPNLKNDGHDTGVDFAGKYLTKRFNQLLNSPQLQQDTLFVVTFDESGSGPTNQIYTVLIGSSVLAGVQNNQAISHTALLKLIEDEFQLGNLSKGDLTSPSLTGIWK